MEWEPDDHGWTAYVKFEVRQQETERARAVYERYASPSLPSSPPLPSLIPVFISASLRPSIRPHVPQRVSFLTYFPRPPTPPSLSPSLPPSLSPLPRYIACHPTQRAFLKYSKWEERSQFQPTFARVIFERALQVSEPSFPPSLPPSLPS